jgi:hypothetical protein
MRQQANDTLSEDLDGLWWGDNLLRSFLRGHDARPKAVPSSLFWDSGFNHRASPLKKRDQAGACLGGG